MRVFLDVIGSDTESFCLFLSTFIVLAPVLVAFLRARCDLFNAVCLRSTEILHVFSMRDGLQHLHAIE